MADPYTQAALIAAPFARLGSQMFQGQNMYEAGRMKSAESVARQNALENHADLYGAQAQKAQAEADAAQQRATYQTPAFATKLAANLAGLSEGQGAEIADYQQRGNWGTNPGYDLPPDQDGPTMPAMPKSAPSWYSPQVEQRVNQARGAALSGLAGTGNSDAKNVLEAFLMAAERGDQDKAMQGGNNGLNAYQAAMKGGMYSSTPRGILNQDGGKEAVNEDWRKVQQSAAAENYAQAGNASASRDLTRSKIGQVTDGADIQAGVPVAAFGKAPSGYRFKPDGSMEPIPGGPADAKAAALSGNKAAGVADVNQAVATLRDAYDKLEKGNGITNTDNGPLSNLSASSSSSAVGQAVGKALGTKNQSERNTIAMTRPALLASLMKATGMSAKQMDSNAELKLWMATATDPTLDVQANRAALEKIEKKYLSGESPVNPPAMPQQERQQSVLAARQAIANGKDRAEVIRRLEAAGISDHGLK